MHVADRHFGPRQETVKGRRAPVVLLVLLYLCFLACWTWAGSQLPERVATHFGAGGQANGWMSRSASQWLVLSLSLFLPSIVVALSCLTRYVPGITNIPNRDFWLAPERRTDTVNYLVGHSLWFASLAVWFVLGIEYSIVRANEQSPPRLSNPMLALVVGPFLLGTAAWVAILLRRFRLGH